MNRARNALNSSMEQSDSRDETTRLIQWHRVESARRSMRSALHLLTTTANTFEYKGDLEGARRMRVNIDEIKKRLADIDLIAEEHLGTSRQP